MFPGICIQEKEVDYKAEELQVVKNRLNSKKDRGGNIGTIFKLFPWLENFFETAFRTKSDNNTETLLPLLLYFFSEVSISTEDCWKKPTKAVWLKFLLEEILMFFNDTYRRTKSSSSTQTFYMNAITHLVALFIDLKIMLVRRGLESLKKKGYSLLSTLFLFLDNSEEHVAEALLKARNITKSNENIISSLLGEFLKDGKFTIRKEESYLRFILVFKLWKDICTNPKEKVQICWLATSKLNPSKIIIKNVREMDWIHPLLPQIHHKNNITFVIMNLKLDFINTKTEFFKRYGLTNEYEKKIDSLELTHFDLGLKNQRVYTSKEKTQFNVIKEVFPIKVYNEGEAQDSTESFDSTPKDTTHFQTMSEKTEDENPSFFLSKGQVFLTINDNQEKPTKKKPCIHFCSYQCSEGIQTLPALRHKVTRTASDELKKSPTRIQNVEFDKLAKRYKIVKSKSLKIGLISKEQQTKAKKSIKKLEFSSKVVKVSEEEVSGAKPNERMKSWRSIRRERLEEGKIKEESWVKEEEKRETEVKTDRQKSKTGSFETAGTNNGKDSSLFCCEVKESSQFDQQVLEQIISEDSVSVSNSYVTSSSATSQSTTGSEFSQLFHSHNSYTDSQDFSTNFEKDFLIFDEQYNVGMNSSTILDFEEFDKDYFSSTKDELEGNLREDLYNSENEDLMDFNFFNF